jgi:hypothetical protein
MGYNLTGFFYAGAAPQTATTIPVSSTSVYTSKENATTPAPSSTGGSSNSNPNSNSNSNNVNVYHKFITAQVVVFPTQTGLLLVSG